uniref:Uncharacterized protein n=1 Tax=Anguilla anguilla TaxID=7936 RepID=A0A0E9QF97_ANGAN
MEPPNYETNHRKTNALTLAAPREKCTFISLCIFDFQFFFF